ncbi:hypothetical protein J6590_049379 [Homalodisca vitripennis]|nr:hypothetical protein J6590_049379 [Homalodisca vitripennis]
MVGRVDAMRMLSLGPLVAPHAAHKTKYTLITNANLVLIRRSGLDVSVHTPTPTSRDFEDSDVSLLDIRNRGVHLPEEF